MYKTLTWWRATYWALGRQKVHLLYISIQSADILNFQCPVNILVANCNLGPNVVLWRPGKSLTAKCCLRNIQIVLFLWSPFTWQRDWHLPDRETDILCGPVRERSQPGLRSLEMYFPAEETSVLGLNVQKCRKKRLKVRLVICIASHFKEMGRILEKVNMQTRNIWLPHLLATS